MKRLQALLVLLALGAAVAAMVVLVTHRRPDVTTTLPVEIQRASPAEKPVNPRIELVKGGIYAGVVEDAGGHPVEAATVFLVAYRAGDRVGLPPPGSRPAERDAGPFDLARVPTIGFETAAEGKTDAGGRFRLAADAQSAVRLVAAHRMGYMPQLVEVRGPRDDLRLVLQEAGQFVGTVIDEETREPVPHAKVTIYLQQRVSEPGSDAGDPSGGTRTWAPLSPFAIAQKWVVEALGERVWGLTTEGEPGLRTWTDEGGEFRFGPIGDQVQLEFVIDHPGYMWTEHDGTKEGHARRTVVAPGQTVERTFLMWRGKEIAGKVIDDATGKGVPDVQVAVEHVAQYKQHWWYRVKKRRARTARDGSFRVRGLSYGPYIATLTHPTFGSEFIPSIPEGGTDLRWYVKPRGAIEGTLEGLERATSALSLVLESTEVDPQYARRLTYRPTLRADGTFLISGVRPGRYRVWVRAEGRTSMPEEIEIVALETKKHRFELGGGGTLDLEIRDASGGVVDPAEVRLVRLGDDATPAATLGHFVTRGGRLLAPGIAPGRYAAEARAPGFLPGRTEPFTVHDEGRTDAGVLVLERQAWLRIVGVSRADRRPLTGHLEMEVQEGPDGTFRRLPPLTGAEVAVQPGPLIFRARSSDGLAFETTLEVAGGETARVQVELR